MDNFEDRVLPESIRSALDGTKAEILTRYAPSLAEIMRGYVPEGAKRRYPAHFLSKLTDADGELQETRHWLISAGACGYLSETDHKRFESAYESVGRMLGAMIAKHESFCLR